MPLYSFRTHTGSPREVWMPMAEAVPIGETITHKGEVLTRVPETRQTTRARPDIHYTDVQMAPWTSGGPRYDQDGMIQFDSMREVEEFHARKSSEGHPTWIDK